MCVQFIGMGTVTTALRGKNATQGQPRKLDYLHTKYVIQLRDLPADLSFDFFSWLPY